VSAGAPTGCDVAVVGAGMAGVSAAAAVAAAGRSAALFDEGYGNEVVRRLTVASRAFMASPPDGFSDTPLLGRRGCLRVGRPGDEDVLDEVARAAAALVPTVRRIGADEAVERCGILSRDYVAGAVWDDAAADIDVDALLQGHLRALRAAGGQVCTGASLVEGRRHGRRWSLSTTAGGVDAGVVVDAAGAWADPVAARCGVAPLGLQPMRRTAFLFDPPGGGDPRPWPMVIDVHERWYFKPEGGRLLGSPADETPSEPVDARAEELDVAMALDRIGEALGVELRHADRPWAGLRTFAPDRTPVVGPDPDVEGFVWLAGQGGYGIQTSPAMAEAAAGWVTAGALPARLADHGIAAGDLDPGRLRSA
jgi:D-arginine dehydrogenase